MILAELSIVLIAIAGVCGIKVLSKKMGYKLSKKKLKKLLMVGFDLMDADIIHSAIMSLMDFDGKHNSKKLDKYLLEVVKTYRDDETKPTLNEKNVLNLVKEFTMDNIFDDDVIEEERQLDIIEEKMEETKQVLNEVDKRRKEIMLRKNMIRQRQIAKSSKHRTSSAMG